MNLTKKRKQFSLFIVLTYIFLSSNIINLYTLKLNSNKDNLNKDAELLPPETVKKADVLDPKTEVIGSIDNQEGKIFCNISTTTKDSYINRYQPGLNNQPNLFLQNWNLTHAKMVFENIKALNYTRSIETEPTEFIISYSEIDPLYVYQKFSVETDQYVNNVSIFIQDVNDEDYYSEENSWEVSIVNCSDDPLGTPNSNQTLGILRKPHPIDMVAHWEVFDFLNSDIGPIFLNKSKTNSTNVNGIKKYWFAIKIKIPPNDERTGGGPKFLYLNPDGEGSNENGEGETFAQSPQFLNLTYNKDDVTETRIISGNYIKGDINSFKNFDENRYIINSTLDVPKQKITFTIKIEVDNLTNSDYTWDDLKNIRKDYPLEWKNILNSIIFSINFSLVSNVSNNEYISWAKLWGIDPETGGLSFIPHQFDLLREYESIQSFTAIDPEEKLYVIQHMNTSVNGNNSIIFVFHYEGIDGSSIFNTSINLFDVEIGEIKTIKTIQKYDPIVHELHFANNVTLLNSTFDTPTDQIIESIQENDNNFLQVQGDLDSNTTIIDFKFNILESLNSSLWDVDDPIEWIFQSPNPRIYQIDFRISSNVSIQNSKNLTHAILEIYNGGDFFGFEWFQFSDNKTFADIGEDTKILKFDSYYTWIIMHMINESEDNSLRVRLRFIGNGTFNAINVSIDEFTLNFHVQNAISSDIASKIGFGINSNNLKPSDIQLKNFGTNVSDNGLWESKIQNGIPVQGVYYFNVTSIWPEVQFDVNGIYTIEKYQNVNWEYIIDGNLPKIQWNISSEINYDTIYTKLETSQSLQFNVPSDWLLMEIYNSSVSPPSFNGGWYSIIQSDDQFKIMTVYNISDGTWKISMNSSKNMMLLNLNSTNNVFIDKIVNIEIQNQEFSGGDVYFEVYNSDSLIIYSESSSLNETEHSISYIWDIFSTTKTPGIYSLKAYWIFSNDTHAFLALNTTEIIISKYSVNLEILNIDEYSKEYISGRKILIEGMIVNNETGDTIEGETIIAEIYDRNMDLITTKSDITNIDGLIQIEYALPNGYNSISILIVYNTTDTYYNQATSAQSIEIKLISQSEYYMDIFFNILPYIGALLGVSIASVVAVKYRKSKLRRFWAGEAMILDDLLKTSHIMIIHKDVGVSIYDKQISLDLDVDLISGFLQAISAFRSEIKKEKEESIKGKGFEMDYYDFKIVITDGNYVRTALILDGIPSEKLKENQWAFTEHFEKRFEGDLKDFTGDITSFRKADDLIERYFNISLVYPLQLGKHYEVIKIKGLDKALLEVAEQIQKERKFFFISSLLNFALAGRKASRDEIISVIIDLKRKGLIIPASIE
ncbi:MAG: hypothetical protein HWN81_05510 [Candidatus Lokiarchaeota archaeon]|nr:hypothetical protein [Candidatus Lokiarchaeota archaeon]